MLHHVSIEGFRSIRSLEFELGRITVVTGENGAGKTNFYRAISLLREAAVGDLAKALGEEGGMASALWAGTVNAPAAREARLMADVDDLRYSLRIGTPGPNDPALALDPVVREEVIAARIGTRATAMLHRKGASVTARAPDGRWRPYPNALLMAETALAMLRDPRQFPELDKLQRTMAAWRFHHIFRCDPGSPIRQPQVAICAPTLDADGINLAATLATALHLGEDGKPEEIARAIDAAFPGTTLDFAEAAGRYAVALRNPGFQRSFAAHELSDGTLRYICLLGALCAYRRPAFIALNEPEASLHRDLIAPLGQSIIDASSDSQILVVTHSPRLADQLVENGAKRIDLVKHDGETTIARQLQR